VPGASAQASRIAKLIRYDLFQWLSSHSLQFTGSVYNSNHLRDNTANNKLGEIFVTLDSHHKKHIAHKSFWSSFENDVNNKCKEPSDFEVITEQSLEHGLWYPKDCTLQVRKVRKVS